MPDVPETHQNANADALPAVRSPTEPLLSSGETAVIVLLADGLRVAGIAERLDLAESTIRGSLQLIRDKVGGAGQHAMLDQVYRGGHLPAPAVRLPEAGTELGPEQLRILLLTAAGATGAEIASALDIWPSTAEARIAGVRTALGGGFIDAAYAPYGRNCRDGPALLLGKLRPRYAQSLTVHITGAAA